MKARYYVGRVHNNDVRGILEKDNQYSFDDDDPLLKQSLRRINLAKLKYAKTAPEKRLIFVENR